MNDWVTVAKDGNAVGAGTFNLDPLASFSVSEVHGRLPMGHYWILRGISPLH